MSRLLYVGTHPEVQVEPQVPVPQWGLSADGYRRAEVLLTLPWVSQLAHVFSSAERKALQTAELLAVAVDRPVVVDEELRENDRSSTGFLPPAEFEAAADLFFRAPTASARGWETAHHAQQRVVAAVHRCLAQASTGDVAVVAHGAVRHPAVVPPGRSAHQPAARPTRPRQLVRGGHHDRTPAGAVAEDPSVPMANRPVGRRDASSQSQPRACLFHCRICAWCCNQASQT